jgi:phospholipid/cholesterol/gamma-HCH transport system ATP-binding protein
MIELKDITKSFRNKPVLRGVSLDVQTGETLVIIGRSGSGKSVILKHIIGLLKPDSGSVWVDGEDITQMSIRDLYAVRSKFGMLFQGAALFDSMTVGENVSLALRENFKMTEDQMSRIVAEKLELVGLEGTERLKPSELSGGMRKRVGLARALATSPRFILYDEPTTGLDPVMSDSIDNLINTLADTLGVTSVVVTHDMQSVYKTADRVAMLYEGRIYFTGTPDDLKTSTDHVIRNFADRTSINDEILSNEMSAAKSHKE